MGHSVQDAARRAAHRVRVHDWQLFLTSAKQGRAKGDHMRLWLALSAFLLAASPVAAFAEEVKLGYVDLQRAINETDDGRKAKDSLKKIFDQKQKELDEQQQALKKDKDDLDKKRTLLPADKLREKEMELQGRLEKLEQTYMRHQQDLQAKQQEATAKIFERMTRIITKI